MEDGGPEVVEGGEEDNSMTLQVGPHLEKHYFGL
jgi:hypothetical protein